MLSLREFIAYYAKFERYMADCDYSDQGKIDWLLFGLNREPPLDALSTQPIILESTSTLEKTKRFTGLNLYLINRTEELKKQVFTPETDMATSEMDYNSS
jgi:hypothetical protein